MDLSHITTLSNEIADACLILRLMLTLTRLD